MLLWLALLLLVPLRALPATSTVGCQSRAETHRRQGCRHAGIDHGARDEAFAMRRPRRR